MSRLFELAAPPATTAGVAEVSVVYVVATSAGRCGLNFSLTDELLGQTDAVRVTVSVAQAVTMSRSTMGTALTGATARRGAARRMVFHMLVGWNKDLLLLLKEWVGRAGESRSDSRADEENVYTRPRRIPRRGQRRKE